jgi:hypothetical protein
LASGGATEVTEVDEAFRDEECDDLKYRLMDDRYLTWLLPPVLVEV